MIDREKVIKGLQNLRDAIATDFIHEADQAVGTIDDALALLKEQQQQIWEFQDKVEYLTDKLKNRAEEIERLKTPTAGDNKITLKW